MDRELCQVNLIHRDRVAEARKQLPPQETAERMAAIYKLMGERTRLGILLCLRAGEMCVCDIAATLDSSPSAISHQLKLLRDAGLIHARREGKMVFYRLDDTGILPLLSGGLAYTGKTGGKR